MNSSKRAMSSYLVSSLPVIKIPASICFSGCISSFLFSLISILGSIASKADIVSWRSKLGSASNSQSLRCSKAEKTKSVTSSSSEGGVSSSTDSNS